jgi:site-specific recombinase XerD
MARKLAPDIFTVSVFTRHSPVCPKKDDRYWRRCRCMKALYIYEHGSDQTVSAKTRSWEQAEKIAQAERDRRDPAKSAGQAATRTDQTGAIAVDEALGLWVAGQKDQSYSTCKTYRIFQRKLSRWAAENGMERLGDITAAQLDKWRGEWSKSALRKDDQMGQTTQHQFLSRLKSFFRWAYEIEHLPKDPSKALKGIKSGDEQTIPLDPEQYEQVLVATDLYDAGRKRPADKYGLELKAICLVMRWTGLRITDVLMLPRNALVGNHLNLSTQKTSAALTPILPEYVVEALEAIRPRQGVHPDYFFWSRRCQPESLGKPWATRIRRLNKHLSLTDEQGLPMMFHSHMLRDTFAVEMLLADVPLEDVSRMLSHTSVRVTERHYAPWVKRRRDQLEDKAVAAMRRMGATFTV